MACVMVTGGAGFIGSQLVRSLVSRGHEVVVLDVLNYAGSRKNLDGISHRFVHASVCDSRALRGALDGCDAVIHAAAESHVCRSLEDARPFIETNIEGTRVVLQEAQRAGVERFIHISTDEVFGAARNEQSARIDSPFRPGNAYAASKVGAEAMVSAWRHSHGFPAVIVRCTNNYGPRQHPEKAIPCWTLAALAGLPIPFDGEGRARRDWLHVEDFCEGILQVMEQWTPASTWHFSGRQVRTNRQMVQEIAERCGTESFHQRTERQGQDDVYLLDDEPTRSELGWRPRVELSEGLDRVVEWYRANQNRWS
jgi:dTDP-glucose 4,6-dehydratase